MHDGRRHGYVCSPRESRGRANAGPDEWLSISQTVSNHQVERNILQARKLMTFMVSVSGPLIVSQRGVVPHRSAQAASSKSSPSDS